MTGSTTSFERFKGHYRNHRWMQQNSTPAGNRDAANEGGDGDGADGGDGDAVPETVMPPETVMAADETVMPADGGCR